MVDKEVVYLRPHQIEKLQLALRYGVQPIINEVQGEEVAVNVRILVERITADPELPIVFSIRKSNVCHQNCKVRPGLWHHCKGKAVNFMEKNLAKTYGIKIGGDPMPARRIFWIPK